MPSKPTFKTQMKQMTIKMITPAMTPITMPAIAPGDNELPVVDGSAVGIAVPAVLLIGVWNGWVVVTMAVIVAPAPEVPRNGAE
jgi:hypothetical protein